MWQQSQEHYPFLRQADASDAHALRQLTRDFLGRKEFHGANGLHITDAMAVAIAAQACLPVLHLRAPLAGIDWYDDFVGIVVAVSVEAPSEPILRGDVVAEESSELRDDLWERLS